ncbi:tetratricopeptide (TPR) repeat protein [Salirhabdus euzebyi]|uniref:Tetratricopeptide (TPR) repeat protein n=1 Tax=Salirhabdus euzebyi TaxID=394506 RepID=A0A841Q942_9BACI|nr:zinc ribbon domain-containing protein [Salirhabdus euzebyi]MBB6454833.1 tetratricopeptide (TPR) repeat protein [Salirhabdus euzebyi]
MAHCPYCGTEVKNEELYCIKCGKELPKDLEERTARTKGFNKWWFLPLSIMVLFGLIFLSTFLLSNYKLNKAIEAYEKGEQLAYSGKFKQAKDFFNEAIELKSQFKAATHGSQFMDIAISIQDQLTSANKLTEEEDFQQALTITKQAEESIKNYNGEVVNELLNQILQKRNQIKTEELKFRLEQKPSIQDLKILLWQAETIQNEEAEEITEEIRDRLVDFTFSKANEFLKLKQFSDAITTIKDGLRFAPDSEKLKSLKTTVEKEKIAFETEQQKRIAQAMNAAEQEFEFNKNNAVEIISFEAKKDEYGYLVIKGKIKSIATVPIYSVSVTYNLLNSEGEIVDSNEVFIYPDTLYPDEEGNFEFTHYELEQELSAKVETVQWFLNSP